MLKTLGVQFQASMPCRPSRNIIIIIQTEYKEIHCFRAVDFCLLHNIHFILCLLSCKFDSKKGHRPFPTDVRFYIQFNRLPFRPYRQLLAPRTILLSISVGLIRSYSELIACISLQALYCIACVGSLCACINSHPLTALVLL